MSNKFLDLDGLGHFKEKNDAKYANKDGWYSQLVAGAAENLVDTAATGSEQTIRYRKSGGPVPVVTGNALIKGIKGRTDAWNQIFTKNLNDANLYVSNGSKTYNASDNSLHMVPNNAEGQCDLSWYGHKLIQGHKYAVTFELKTENGGQYQFLISQWAGGQRAVTAGAGTYVLNKVYITATQYASTYTMGLSMYHSADAYDIRNIKYFDLTLAYGSGKEPTTVDAFLKDYPYALGASYNAGKLLGNSVTGMETTGKNQFDENTLIPGKYRNTHNEEEVNANRRCSDEYFHCFPNTDYFLYSSSADTSNFSVVVCWYDAAKNFISGGYGRNVAITSPAGAAYFRVSSAISSGDICVNLSDASVNGTYEPYNRTRRELPITTSTGKLNGTGASQVVFPNGLNGAGTSFDEIVVENGLAKKGIRRRARVDLGTLNWSYNSGATYPYFSATIPNSRSVGNGVAIEMACERYSAVANATNVSWFNSHAYNKMFAMVYDSTTILFQDTSYTTAAAFKTAMSGVYLDYPLATPQTFIFDTPFSVIYPVHANGTEEATPIGLDANGVPESTPFVGTIAYQKDYVKELNELPDRLDEKQDVLTFDDAPTEGSTNPVTSGGVKTALDGKANPDGYYQQMVSGAAESLIAKELSEAVISYRATPSGSGAASIAKIKGRTDIWNQRALGTPSGTSTSDGVTCAIASGKVQLTGTATAQGTVSPQVNAFNLDAIKASAGHKVLLLLSQATSLRQLRIYLGNGNYYGAYEGSINQIQTSPSSVANATVAYLSLGFYNGVTYNIDAYYRFYDLTLMYGTGREPATAAAFLAEYPEALFAPYNAGKLVSNKMTALVTDGFNQWDEQWERGTIDSTTGANANSDVSIRSKNYCPIFPSTNYFVKKSSGIPIWIRFYNSNMTYLGSSATAFVEGGVGAVFTSPSKAAYFKINYGYSSPASSVVTTYQNDICINLSHSGIRNGEYEPYWKSTLNIVHSKIYGKLEGEGEMVQIAPNGFRGVGANYDEVDIVRKEAYIRREWIDLGSLTWTYYNSAFYTGQDYKARASIMCAKYATSPEQSSVANMVDKTISVFDSRRIYVKDTSYTDAAVFKAAMAGVYADIELATPLHYTDLMYSEDGGQTFVELPSNYRVDDFGTEQRLPDGIVDGAPASTPLVALINYPINLPKTYQNQDSMDDLLNKLGSALGFTWSKTWNGVKYVYTITNNS